MELDFTGPVIEWRGPPPFYFVVIPEAESETIGSMASVLTYGWGAIPVSARVGGVDFTRSLFPRDGRYLLPVKEAVRRPLGIGVGDQVSVRMGLVVRG